MSLNAKDAFRFLSTLSCRNTLAIFCEQGRRSAAIVVTCDDFQGIVYSKIWNKQGLQIMKTILSLAQDVQTEVYLDIWCCYHI